MTICDMFEIMIVNADLKLKIVFVIKGDPGGEIFDSADGGLIAMFLDMLKFPPFRTKDGN